jgi:signal transducer and activator of transcription 5B
MFKASVGRGIENENLRFLAGKAFKNSNLQDLNNAFLSWSQFNKELMPKRNFTFWEWFYAIFKLTREHLNGIWNEGLILGFVCRQRTEELLLETCSGTFLLRFSDSELGGIIIAYNAEHIGRTHTSFHFQRPPYQMSRRSNKRYKTVEFFVSENTKR